MASRRRPLSPHLQVYRPQITSVLSITHRLTGLVLAIGALAMAYWLTAPAYGAAAFDRAQAVMGSWFGQLVLIGFTFALYYHLANGVRHLAWDAGWGFELPVLRATGWIVVLAAVGLTVVTWAVVWLTAGGA